MLLWQLFDMIDILLQMALELCMDTFHILEWTNYDLLQHSYPFMGTFTHFDSFVQNSTLMDNFDNFITLLYQIHQNDFEWLLVYQEWLKNS